MGHIPVSHPTGRLEVVPICSRQIGRRTSRYDPFGTLSLITCFVSSLGPLLRPLSFPATHHKQASLRFKSLSLHFYDASRTKVVRNI
ncbi:Uncharacterised protein [Serratia quinivorans]|nr:Uncharacterised protein [Serratia quinivorans]